MVCEVESVSLVWFCTFSDVLHTPQVLSLVSDQQPKEDSERHPGLQPGGKKKLLQSWSVRQEQSHNREQDGASDEVKLLDWLPLTRGTVII